MGRFSRFLWFLRGVWLLLAVAAPWTAYTDRSTPVRLVLEIWGWFGWSVGMVSLAVVVPAALTALRITTPVVAVVSLAALDAGPATWSSPSSWNTMVVLGGAAALVGWLLTISRSVTCDMVQGAAYGDELRWPLRTPLPHLAPAVVAWLLLTVGTVGGSLLFAAGNRPLGAALVLVGVALTMIVPRRLHRLARRWLVRVPAGLVVHDHLVLGESLMIRSSAIVSQVWQSGPGDEADLTGGVIGTRLRISLRDAERAILAPLTARILGTTEALHVSSFAVAPCVARSHRGPQQLTIPPPITN